MILDAAFLLLVLFLAFRELRNAFYATHAGMVLGAVWLIDPTGFRAPNLEPTAVAALMALHLVSINLVTFAAYAWDKRAAIHQRRRTPERTLHALALVGGTPGAWIARRTLRHKSSKGSFKKKFYVIAVVQALALIALLVWWLMA